MKKIYLTVINIIILLGWINAGEITVYPGSSIAKAVAEAKSGDKLIIKEGIYNETGIIIDKPLEINAEGNVIIDAGENDQIITIRSDNVIINGLMLKNSGKSNMRDLAALKIENSKNCSVINCKFLNNFFAVYLANSKHCTIQNNFIQSNAISETSSGNGIHLWKCDSIWIDNNTVTGHRDGIYFEFAVNSKVTNNLSSRNLRYGLHFMFSNNDVYENNTFSENGAGVAVMYTRNVSMINNNFENNWGPNSYGLLLKEITYSRISGNTFYKNTVAIFTEGGVNLEIEKNTFEVNGWAIKVLGSCYDNTLKFNNFLNNSFDIASNSSRNSNIFLNNYWDKYNGYDLNKDGKGDVPYRPTSLFSMMVENSPGTIILLRSMIVDIMDMAEKVMPVFIPESLSDNSPLMNKFNDRDKELTQEIR